MCKTTADPGAQQQQGTLLASVRLGRRGPLRSEGGSWSAGTQPVPGESSLRTAQGGAAPGAVHGADPAELHRPLGRGLGQPQPDPAVPAAGPESALRPGLPLDSSARSVQETPHRKSGAAPRQSAAWRPAPVQFPPVLCLRTFTAQLRPSHPQGSSDQLRRPGARHWDGL